jgi:hypothetical protein
MLLGNQQEIVAFSWNSCTFFITPGETGRDKTIYKWFCRKHCLKASNYEVFRHGDIFKVWPTNTEKSTYMYKNKIKKIL